MGRQVEIFKYINCKSVRSFNLHEKRRNNNRFLQKKKNVTLTTFLFWLFNSLWVGATLDYYYLGTSGSENTDQKELYRKLVERSME